MLFFFAGAEPLSNQSPLRKKKCPNILQSYYYIKASMKQLYDDAPNFLIDSGGYTARLKGVKIDVEEYGEWLNKYKIKVAFNLDTNDLKETLENQRILETRTNTYILPIYHLTDYLSETSLIDDFLKYPYIGISMGGASPELKHRELRKEFLNFVFSKTLDKVAVHGLGITSKSLNEEYPFFSVDSTSWLSAQKYGSPMNEQHTLFSKYASKKIHYNKRNEWEIDKWLIKERQVTNLWQHRGINWPTSLEWLLSKYQSSRKPNGITKPTILRRQKNSKPISKSLGKSKISSLES